MHLSWIDIAIVVVYVGFTILAGTVARDTIRGISDFLVAGRNLKTHMGVATMVSTGLGLVTVMYFAEEGFKYGLAPFIVGILLSAIHLVIGKTGFIVTRLRYLRVMTVPEFYEIKYSRGVRVLGGVFLALAGTLNMGLFPILGSKFVIGFTGLDPQYVHTVMFMMLAVVVFYTLMGGMVSVVLTDFAQFVLLSLGFLFGTYFILTHPQLGWTNVVASVEEHLGPSGLDPIDNDKFGWVFLAWYISARFLGVLWQPTTSRPLSSETPRVARRIYLFESCTAMGRAVIPIFWGAAALCYFGDPGHDSQYAMPQMMGQILPVGVAGLLMAGMFAAFMSTHDSYLLAWSSVIVRDIISPIRAMRSGVRAGQGEIEAGMSSGKEVYWTRAIIVVLAVFLAFFGMYYQIPETSFRFMFITGMIYTSGCVGTVFLGLYWKWSNTVGAYCALVMGGLAPINFLVMKQFPDLVPTLLKPLVETSNLSALLSLILGGTGMIVGSLLTRKSHPPRQLDFSGLE